MARKTVRVEIPRKNPDDILTLMDEIILQHTTLGVDSKLTDAVVNDLKATAVAVKPIRQAAKDAEALAQQKNQEARQKLGVDKGQTSTTPGTGIYKLIDIAEKLQNAYKGNEEAMSGYGYKVVVGSFAPKGKTPKPPTS